MDKANSLLRTFYRWSGKGIFQSIPKSLSEFPGMESVFVEGSHIKVRQHAATTVGETGAVGHSRSGNTAKIHLAVDADGNPVGFKVTPGAASDITTAPELSDKIDLPPTGMPAADKGGDPDTFGQQPAGMGVKPDIPDRRDRARLNVSMDGYLWMGTCINEALGWECL
ncbi:hypothetical protein C7N83_11565 [Neisseria iguanae]|uniref:Transposase IS4-like domain-containing protein n=1 Tax=Neisseria iguanae TaxID=90242 RepID=A0A2P7TXT5_9NEIS|nr:hypothetical protein C7N83_11565 [Neisseria iguanae]